MEHMDHNAGKRPQSVPRRILTLIYKANAVLLGTVSLIMFSLMCIQVFIRYILKGDLRAMEEYIYFFLMWLTMLGAANAVLENSHMRSDTLTSMIKNKRLLNVFMIIVDFVEIIMYGLFAYYSYLYLMECIALPSFSRVWHLPKLLGQSSVFYAGVMMLVFGLYRFYTDIRLRLKAFRAYRSGELGRYDEAEKLLEGSDEL